MNHPHPHHDDGIVGIDRPQGHHLPPPPSNDGTTNAKTITNENGDDGIAFFFPSLPETGNDSTSSTGVGGGAPTPFGTNNDNDGGETEDHHQCEQRQRERRRHDPENGKHNDDGDEMEEEEVEDQPLRKRMKLTPSSSSNDDDDDAVSSADNKMISGGDGGDDMVPISPPILLNNDDVDRPLPQSKKTLGGGIPTPLRPPKTTLRPSTMFPSSSTSTSASTSAASAASTPTDGVGNNDTCGNCGNTVGVATKSSPRSMSTKEGDDGSIQTQLKDKTKKTTNDHDDDDDGMLIRPDDVPSERRLLPHQGGENHHHHQSVVVASSKSLVTGSMVESSSTNGKGFFSNIYKYVDIFGHGGGSDHNNKTNKKPLSLFGSLQIDYPIQFDATKKWTYLTSLDQSPCHEDPTDIPIQVAYQCMNARGEIAHGTKIGLRYDVHNSNDYMISDCTAGLHPNENGGNGFFHFGQNRHHHHKHSFRGVEDVFQAHGGSSILNGIADIKSEIMERGPVVSTSFVLTEAFLKASRDDVTANNNNNNSSFPAFDHAMIGKVHPVLIIGWDLTAFGEVWLLKPLHTTSDTDVASAIATSDSTASSIWKVAFGQFGIDDEILAPMNNFETYTWQPGPYFDLELSATTPQWRSWSSLQVSITHDDLEKLGEALCCNTGDGHGGDGDDDHNNNFMMAASTKKKFVIRDTTKFAHSKFGYLETIKWQKNMGSHPWLVTIAFL